MVYATAGEALLFCNDGSVSKELNQYISRGNKLRQGLGEDVKQEFILGYLDDGIVGARRLADSFLYQERTWQDSAVTMPDMDMLQDNETKLAFRHDYEQCSELLDWMPEKERLALELSADGYTYEEAAEKMSVSVKRYEHILASAREKAQHKLTTAGHI